MQEGLYPIKSKFGSIVLGKTKTNQQIHHENTMFVMVHSSTEILPELQHFSYINVSMLTPLNIDNFWKLETIGITPPEQKEDEAVLEIGLQLKEKDVTRFLWLKEFNLLVTPTNIITYHFTGVPFVIISSPFLLGATIKHHLGKNR